MLAILPAVVRQLNYFPLSNANSLQRRSFGVPLVYLPSATFPKNTHRSALLLSMPSEFSLYLSAYRYHTSRFLPYNYRGISQNRYFKCQKTSVKNQTKSNFNSHRTCDKPRQQFGPTVAFLRMHDNI